MDAEDLKLLRDIALIDLQLKIGASDAEENPTYKNLASPVEEPQQSSTTDFSTPKEFNSNCQEILRQIEKRLLELLQENREKQSILLNYLNNSEKKTDSNDYSIWKIIKCAGIPYFKDLHGYPQPRNDDVKEKLANGQLCCIDYLTLPRIWTQHYKNTLKKAVLGNSNSASLELGDENEFENTYDPGGKEKPENRKVPIDWLKISAMDFNGKYSAAECESQWKLHLAPNVNKGKWSANEIKTLDVLAKKYKYQDWDNIAAELGTNRTGYQCCIQYQTKNSLNEGKWSQTEDAYLEELVKKFTRRNHVPWTKVSWYFQTRSRKQCQERYLEHLKSDLKRGHFSDAEDKIIISGVKIFKDFGKIARFLPGRAPTQIRSRYYYLISTSMSEFTKEEDDLLVSLAKQHPKNWLKISESFQNRSKLQCRKRYSTLCKQERQGGESVTEGELCTNSKETNPVIPEKKTKKKAQRKKQSKVKEDNDVFSEIVQYHESCSENYFGPRIRNPTEDELKEICLKLKATMAMLSVSCDFSDKSNLINLVKHNSNFDPYDIKILNSLSEEDKTDGPSLRDNYLLHGMLIPPNYNTLIGLNSLIANRAKIKCKTSENEGIPQTGFTTEDNKSEGRLSFTRAKALFRSRLLSLFYLPWMLTLIPTSQINWDVFHKAKRRKPKQLTKKRLKNHAKSMSFAYQEKRKRQREAEESQKELGESENGYNVVKKFKSS